MSSVSRRTRHGSRFGFSEHLPRSGGKGCIHPAKHRQVKLKAVALLLGKSMGTTSSPSELYRHSPCLPTATTSLAPPCSRGRACRPRHSAPRQRNPKMHTAKPIPPPPPKRHGIRLDSAPLTLIQSNMLGFYLNDNSEPSILTMATTLRARER